MTNAGKVSVSHSIYINNHDSNGHYTVLKSQNRIDCNNCRICFQPNFHLKTCCKKSEKVIN